MKTRMDDAKPVALWIAVGLSIALALLFSLFLPPDSASLAPKFRGLNPDENSHLEYIRLLRETGGPVKFLAGDPAYYETHQPPLYYLFALPLYPLGIGAVRLVAAVFGAATVFVGFRATRDLLPNRPEIAAATAFFLALLPAQAQLAGAVNNDSLTTLVCTAIFWSLGRLVTRGQTTRESLWLAALIGLGLWTKLTVLQLLPTVVIAFGIAARAGLLSWKRAATLCALAIAAGFLIASPWLIRNTLLYGDPFNLKIFPLTAGPDPATPEKMRALFSWDAPTYWRTVFLRSWATFFYILPPNAYPKPAPAPFALAAIVSVAGLFGAFRFARNEGPAARRLVALFTLGLLVLVPFFVRFNATFFQAQGRYFHPALFPAMSLLALGLAEIVPENRRGLALGAVAALFALLALAQLLSLDQALQG